MLPTAQFLAFALLLPTCVLCLYGLSLHHHAILPALKACFSNKRNSDIREGGMSLIMIGIFFGIFPDIIVLLVGWTPQLSIIDRSLDAFAGIFLAGGLVIVVSGRGRNPRRMIIMAWLAVLTAVAGAFIIEKVAV